MKGNEGFSIYSDNGEPIGQFYPTTEVIDIRDSFMNPIVGRILGEVITVEDLSDSEDN